MSHHLTLHIIASVPYSNLNRDDTGTPKHVRRGGYLAALLSSQSIKGDPHEIRGEFAGNICAFRTVGC